MTLNNYYKLVLFHVTNNWIFLLELQHNIKLSEKCIIMPCFNEECVDEKSFMDSNKYKNNTFDLIIFKYILVTAWSPAVFWFIIIRYMNKYTIFPYYILLTTYNLPVTVLVANINL